MSQSGDPGGGDRDGGGFLSRWSRRKQAQRQGLPLHEPPAPLSTPSAPLSLEEKSASAPLNRPQLATKNVANDWVPTGAPPQPQSEAKRAPQTTHTGTVPTAAAAVQPTLDDVAQLPAGSEVSRFVQRSVAPEVRNAAFKKLFADPHFNVMDRLDTYIDDYHTPNPLPASVVRQMAVTDFLGWNKPKEEAAAPAAAKTTAAGASEGHQAADPGGASGSTRPPDAALGGAPAAAPAAAPPTAPVTTLVTSGDGHAPARATPLTQTIQDDRPSAV